MSSDIRALLAAAQQAEHQGDRQRAIERLQQAAEFYRSRRMGRRAAQMERHIDRLEGRSVQVPLDAIADPNLDAFDEDEPSMSWVLDDAPLDDDGLGFGDELLAEPARARLRDDGLFERGPQRADPAIDAWCSFCCKPKGEVGPLVAGPAGAFICASCTGLTAALLAVQVPEAAAVTAPAVAVSKRPEVTLPAQREARARWDRRRPRVALVVGPEGAGKTVLLESLGRLAARPFLRGDGDLALLDVAQPLSVDEEAALIRWLDGHAARRVALAARGAVPMPALTLPGPDGDEAVFDTQALANAVGSHVSASLLSRVDGVLPLPAPGFHGLRELGQALLTTSGRELPVGALDALVEIADRSGRGARELAALLSRLPR